MSATFHKAFFVLIGVFCFTDVSRRPLRIINIEEAVGGEIF